MYLPDDNSSSCTLKIWALFLDVCYISKEMNSLKLVMTHNEKSIMIPKTEN